MKAKALARLRVCGSCEWVFSLKGCPTGAGCPLCGFGSYGAFFCYSTKAYKYAKTQEPWRNAQLTSHSLLLDAFIRQMRNKGEGLTPSLAAP